LNNLHKKINKELDSRKAEDHRFHARREETRGDRHFGSVGRYQNHSQKYPTTISHAFSRVENNASLSSIRHHKR
jgi:hypothetical protein